MYRIEIIYRILYQDPTLPSCELGFLRYWKLRSKLSNKLRLPQPVLPSNRILRDAARLFVVRFCAGKSISDHCI